MESLRHLYCQVRVMIRYPHTECRNRYLYTCIIHFLNIFSDKYTKQLLVIFLLHIIYLQSQKYFQTNRHSLKLQVKTWFYFLHFIQIYYRCGTLPSIPTSEFFNLANVA